MEYLYKQQNKINFILIFLIISIAFENLKIIQLLGAPVKITHIVFILGIISTLYIKDMNKQFTLNQIIIFIFYLIIPIIPIYRISDIQEFIKTYAIYIIMLLFIIFAYDVFLRVFQSKSQLYISIFLYLIFFIQLLGVIQFLCMNYFNYFFLEGIWGGNQFHNNIFGMQYGLYRTFSIFHEPSVFGWVSTSSFAICEYLRKNLHLNKIKYLFFQLFNLVAIAVSISASALLITIIIFSISILLEVKKPLKFISIIIMSIVVIFLFSKYTVLFNSFDRLDNEINTSNTSGYERLISPWQYLVRTLNEYPLLGRGLGQEGNIDAVGKIGLYNGVNNSLYGIFVNFGLSALFFIFILIIYAISKMRKNKSYLLLIAAVLGMYISTGAYLSLDTFVLLIIILLIGDLPKKLN